MKKPKFWKKKYIVCNIQLIIFSCFYDISFQFVLFSDYESMFTLDINLYILLVFKQKRFPDFVFY